MLGAAAYNAIHDWAEAVTGLTFVWRDQPEAPRPPYPYGSLKVLAVTPVGDLPERVITIDGNDRSETLRTQGEASVSLQVYSTDPKPTASASYYAQIARALLMSETSLGTLTGGGVAPLRSTGVTDISEVSGAEWLSRANVDLFFSVPIEGTQTVTTVGTATGEGTYTAGENEYTDTFTATE